MTDDERQCVDCSEVKPIVEFSLTGHGFRRRFCNPCRSLRRKSGRESLATRCRQFGISLDDYDSMWESQGGKCAICLQEETATVGRHSNPNATRLLAIDHCHSTGRVRGLLCYRCNVAIGLLHEKPERFARASQYLERHQ